MGGAINKFTVFREMLDYIAHMSDVTDADMNYYHDTMKIAGQTDVDEISIEVTIKKKKEVLEDDEP